MASTLSITCGSPQFARICQGLLFLTLGAVTAAQPVVSKIEPPSWWAGHSANPVRLLVTGSNLHSAVVKVPKGFSTSNTIVSSNGNYLFLDLNIPSDARPGDVSLKFKSRLGTGSASFRVLSTLQPAGKFSGFSTDDVIYLALPDRFANGDSANDEPAVSRGLLNRAKPRDYHGGDFQGVIDRLPYLREIGVTALWLTPWYDNVNHANTREKYTPDNKRSSDGVASTDYHGYGAVDFYGVEERFGDMAKLQELVQKAQAMGFKVIQDQVANHTGPYHAWARNPPTPTWFNGTEDNHLDNSWQTWTLAETNPPADKLKSTLEGWFINVLPDLNQNDPETATYLIQNSLWWIGMTGLDAVRQDTLPYVPRGYWASWTAALKKQHPQLTILGEMFDASPRMVAFFQGGRRQFDGVDSGIDTLFDFPLHYALRDVFAKRQPMTRLSETFKADALYVDPSVLVTFMGLHDTSRFMNEPGADITGLNLAFTCLATVRGTPLIYYGDEIALPGGGDPDNRRDFPGGWKEDPRNAFTPSGRTADEETVHSHVRRLFAVRRDVPALRGGRMIPLVATESTFAFARVAEGSAAIVTFNNSDRTETLRITLPAQMSATGELFDRLSTSRIIPVTHREVTVELPPRTAAIWTPNKPELAHDRLHTAPGLMPAASDINGSRN
jgi:glycosidase